MRRQPQRQGHRLRRVVVGAGLSLAVASGVAACGSSAKTDNSPSAPAGSTNAPTQATTPPTMAPATAPSSGGVSY